MRPCPACQHQVDDGFRFCPQCGTPMDAESLPDSSSESAGAPPVPPPLPVPPPPVPPVPAVQAPPAADEIPEPGESAAIDMPAVSDGPPVPESSESSFDDEETMELPSRAPDRESGEYDTAVFLDPTGLAGAVEDALDSIDSGAVDPGVAPPVITEPVAEETPPPPIVPEIPPVPPAGPSGGAGSSPTPSEKSAEKVEPETVDPGMTISWTGGIPTAVWIGGGVLVTVIVVVCLWWFLRSSPETPVEIASAPAVTVEPLPGFEAPDGEGSSEFPLVDVPEEAPSKRPRRWTRPTPKTVPPTPTPVPSPTPTPVFPTSGIFELEGAGPSLSNLPEWKEPAALLLARKQYKGRSSVFSVGEVPHLRGTNIGDNAATSIRVIGGARVTLFLKPGFDGRSETFTEDCPDLSDRVIRNNRASSVRIEPPAMGSRRWNAGPFDGFGIAVVVEGRLNGVSIRKVDDSRGEHAVYLFRDCVAPTGPGLGEAIAGRMGLAERLGPALTGGVRLFDGALAGQLFDNGIVLFDPSVRRVWYRLDHP